MTDPTTHPRLSPLLAGILDEPDCDVRRLAFADALEEFGDNDDQFRAEFIRVQVELAKLHTERRGYKRGGGVRAAKALDDALRRRERELLDADTAVGWTNGVHQMLRGNGVGIDVLLDGTWQGSGNWGLFFRRGFVGKVKLSAAACLRHLDALRMVQPVRHVTLTTTPRASGARLNDGRWKVWFEEAPGKAVVAASLPPVSRTVEWLLDQLFPGIAFTTPSQMADINGLLDQIRNQAAHVVGDGNVRVGPMGGYADVNEYGAPRRPGRPFLGGDR